MLMVSDKRRERGKKKKKGGKKTGWTSDFILKGHGHHRCILLQPAFDSRASPHLYQRNAIERIITIEFTQSPKRRRERRKWGRRGGSDGGGRKSIRLSAFTAFRIDLSPPPAALPALSYSEVCI